MILIEVIKKSFWWIARFFYWLITARDCEHCEWSSDHGLYCTCWNTPEKKKACMKSLRKVAFERKKEDN